MNRREIMNLVGAGAIGGIIGYYTGAKKLLGIQPTDSDSPSNTITTKTDAGSTPNQQGIIDGFESGAYDDDTPVTWNIKSPGEYIRVQSEQVQEGDHALVARSGENKNNIVQFYHHAEERIIKDGDEFQAWIRADARAYHNIRSQLESAANQIQTRVTTDHNNLAILTFDEDGNQIDKKRHRGGSKPTGVVSF